MNLRHAAALSLVGWYLLQPPRSAPGKFDASAPLSKWEQDSTHDSSAACEQAKLAMVYVSEMLLTSLRKSSESEHTRANVQFILRRYFAARCIATDDPRLKER
jgi:hypothetical protein